MLNAACAEEPPRRLASRAFSGRLHLSDQFSVISRNLQPFVEISRYKNLSFTDGPRTHQKIN
eukprot:2515102-Rhodomonas_salina.2